MRPPLRARRWAHFDMHHLLWEPALGPERFFELYCETWRRSVLNLRGRKSLWQWLREVDPRNACSCCARCADAADDGPAHYLAEYRLDHRRSLGRADDVLAKWMALSADERTLISEANLHRLGVQLDPDMVRRDLATWRSTSTEDRWSGTATEPRTARASWSSTGPSAPTRAPT